MYECIDKNPDSVSGSASNINGVFFYHDEAHCNGMAWPPYNLEKELTCAVFINEARQHNQDDMSSCAPGAI